MSLARCGGTVKLNNPSPEEKEDLGGFFGKSYTKNKSITISAENFHKQLGKTRFSEVSLEELLENYFGETLESKREQKAREEQEWLAYLEEIQIPFEETFSGKWLRQVINADSHCTASVYLKQLYAENKEGLQTMLHASMDGANQFPVFQKRIQMLAVFSAELTGNPHYFDEGTQANRILSYLMEEYVQAYCIDEGVKTIEEHTYVVEKKTQLMYQVGLAKDDISNRTVMYGIHLRKKNGQLHQGTEGFYVEKQPVTVMLCQMQDISQAKGDSDKVYVFENPSVFSAFVDRTKEKSVSVVCTYGQLTLTSLLLLDLLVNGGSTLYYAGDFDPEGLKIADKLKLRFGEKLILWHYQAEDYRTAKSDVAISTERLEKVKNLHSEQLKQMGQLLNAEKMAGYQERLIETYVSDRNREFY